MPKLKLLELRGHDNPVLHAVLHSTPVRVCCAELPLSCINAVPLYRLACLNEIINTMMFMCKMCVHSCIYTLSDGNIYIHISTCHVHSNICSIHPTYQVATLWSNKLAIMRSVTHVLFTNNRLYPAHHALMMEKENVFAPLNFGPELA